MTEHRIPPARQLHLPKVSGNGSLSSIVNEMRRRILSEANFLLQAGFGNQKNMPMIPLALKVLRAVRSNRNSTPQIPRPALAATAKDSLNQLFGEDRPIGAPAEAKFLDTDADPSQACPPAEGSFKSLP